MSSLDDYAAGLVGINYGSVTASYSTAAVTGGDKSAGFVGNNMGSITNSYSTGAVGVAGASTGHAGFVGENTGGSITASYWDTQTSGQTASPGGGTGKTTLELQTPVEYGTTGIYRTWDADDIDGDTIADAPWDFGTNSEYPLLIFAGHSLQTQYPENLTAEYVLAAPGSGQVTLTWSIRSIVGVTGWEFDYKTYSTGSWVGWADVPSSTARTTTHVVSSLTNGTTYVFRVRPKGSGLTRGTAAETIGTPGGACLLYTSPSPRD